MDLTMDVEKNNSFAGECEILLEYSRPDIYRINAFRISGLNVNATTREISNQVQKNQLMEKYGGKKDNHKSPFPIEPPPDIDKLRQALHRLRDPETRIIDEFFWFWPHSIDTEEDHALDALSRSDIKTAESLWINYEATLTESNVSRHNLAVLSHLLVLDIELNGNSLAKEESAKRDNYWKDTFKRWLLLIEHEGFWSRLTARVRQMDDPRLTTGFVKRMRESLPTAILQINAQLALSCAELGNKQEAKRHIDLIYKSGFDTNVCINTINRVIGPTRKRIKIICQSLMDSISNDINSKFITSRKIIEQTKIPLMVLDILLPGESTLREGAHDEIALSSLDILISYCNESKNWKKSLDAIEELKDIVRGESAGSKIRKNYYIIKNNYEYGLCFYCKENNTDANSEVEIKMHGDVERYYWSNQITWRYITVKVPRCDKCKKQHNALSFYTWGTGVISVIIGIICWANIIEGGFWAFAIISGLGFTIGYLIGTSKCKTTKYNHYNEFPQIKELIRKGWSWGEKPNTN
jgi:hypothetical protein